MCVANHQGCKLEENLQNQELTGNSNKKTKHVKLFFFKIIF